MTVESFAKETGFEILAMPAPALEVDGAYVGDLFSWVMGKAGAGNVWITIMSNSNIIAVASLREISSVILAEGVLPDAGVLALAEQKEINILRTELSAFDAATKIASLIR